MKVKIEGLVSIEEQIKELERQRQEVLARNRTEFLDCVRDAVRTFNFTAEDIGLEVTHAEMAPDRGKRTGTRKQQTSKTRANRRLVTVCVPHTGNRLQLYLNQDGSFTRIRRGKSPAPFDSKINDGTIGEWIVEDGGEASPSEGAI